MLTFGREGLEKWCARGDVLGVLTSQGRAEGLRVHAIGGRPMPARVEGRRVVDTDGGDEGR